jgi:D-lactate dehydrogenase
VIAHCVEVAGWEADQLRSAFEAERGIEPQFLPGRLDRHLDEVAEARVLSTFCNSSVTAMALERMPSLELIATRSTGYDHIDVEACSRRGITVANVPTYGENTVAEHAFAMILALSRRLLQAERRGRRGEFVLEGLQGFDLNGKTLGVIGAGRIGLHVIRIGRAFEMEVLVYDPRSESILAEVLGFAYVPLDELLARSHVVSLHAPATPATHHMIDAAALSAMRGGAILINTARGDLVDTTALVDALADGQLGGAALDVFEGEREIGEEQELLSENLDPGIRTALGRRLLADREDVILTPHNAFNSVEAVQRIAGTTVANIAAWARGEAQNLVESDRWGDS